MAKKIVRKGDPNNARGKVINACDTVIINGKATARKGDPVNQHPGKGNHSHPINPIMQGNNTVIIGGKAVAYVNSQDRCQHKMADGSNNVVVG